MCMDEPSADRLAFLALLKYIKELEESLDVERQARKSADEKVATSSKWKPDRWSGRERTLGPQEFVFIQPPG